MRRRNRDDTTSARALELAAPFKGRIALVGVLVAVGAVGGVAQPLLVRVMFDKALFCRSGCPNMARVDVLTAAQIGLLAALTATTFAETFLTASIAQRLVHDLRRRLFAHLQRVPLSFFTHVQAGELQTRLVGDVGGISQALTQTTPVLVSGVTTLIGCVVGIGVISWLALLLTLVMVPIAAGVSMAAGRAQRRLTDEGQLAFEQLASVTAESLSADGIETARLFAATNELTRRYDIANRTVLRIALKQRLIGRLRLSAMTVSFGAMPVLTYFVAAHQLRGEGSGISLGSVVAIATLQGRMFWPLSNLSNLAVTLSASGAYFRRVFDVFSLPTTYEPRSAHASAEVGSAQVTFEGVRFAYPPPLQLGAPASQKNEAANRVWALQLERLDVRSGETVAIIGASGAGKTTLLRLLAGLYTPSSGHVLLNGREVGDYAPQERAVRIGVVPQDPYFFHGSIRENLTLGLENVSDEMLDSACAEACIADLINALPDRYEARVGSRGAKLSMGERQRLAIARLYVRDPELVLLDEATASLDAANARLVTLAYRRCFVGRTTILIAHNLAIASQADRIVVLHNGRKAEEGTHNELLMRDRRYADLWRRSQKSDQPASRETLSAVGSASLL